MTDLVVIWMGLNKMPNNETYWDDGQPYDSAMLTSDVIELRFNGGDSYRDFKLYGASHISDASVTQTAFVACQGNEDNSPNW